MVATTIYSNTVFTIKDMLLNILVLSQATNMDEIVRRNISSSQVLAILNFTLLNNLLIHSQPNTEFYNLGLKNKSTLLY